MVFVVAGFLIMNSIAYMQAWNMTHFAPGGERTPPPEALSALGRGAVVIAGVKVPKPQNQHTPGDIGLPYQVHHVSVGNGEGETLEAWHVPHPQARGVVLMFPGYAVPKDGVLGAARPFHGLGYDLFMVDYRGVGGSSGQDTTLAVREGADVAIAVDYVRRTWPGKPVVLYGVSMGSAAVLRAIAAEGARPDGIIIESAFDRMLQAVRYRFDAVGLPSFPASELLLFWGSVQHGFNGFAHNPVEYARSVECPALVMHGELDARVTVEEARSIYEQMRGPKEFVLFPAAGHELLAGAAPGLWRERVSRFLESVAPGH
jgi:alpha-beta hydrolase superfamily lysophospholipase